MHLYYILNHKNLWSFLLIRATFCHSCGSTYVRVQVYFFIMFLFLLVMQCSGSNIRVKALFEAGIDLNVRNEYGQTAVLLAAAHGHSNTVSYLLSIGADANICDNAGVYVFFSTSFSTLSSSSRDAIHTHAHKSISDCHQIQSIRDFIEKYWEQSDSNYSTIKCPGESEAVEEEKIKEEKIRKKRNIVFYTLRSPQLKCNTIQENEKQNIEIVIPMNDTVHVVQYDLTVNYGHNSCDENDDNKLNNFHYFDTNKDNDDSNNDSSDGSNNGNNDRNNDKKSDNLNNDIHNDTVKVNSHITDNSNTKKNKNDNDTSNDNNDNSTNTDFASVLSLDAMNLSEKKKTKSHIPLRDHVDIIREGLRLSIRESTEEKVKVGISLDDVSDTGVCSKKEGDEYEYVMRIPTVTYLIPLHAAHAGASSLYIDDAFSEIFLLQLEELFSRLPVALPERGAIECASRSYYCDSIGWVTDAIAKALTCLKDTVNANRCDRFDVSFLFIENEMEDNHMHGDLRDVVIQKQKEEEAENEGKGKCEGEGKSEGKEDGEGGNGDEGWEGDDIEQEEEQGKGIPTARLPVSPTVTQALPNMRFLNYSLAGSSSPPHVDLSRRTKDGRRSTHTFLLYLTDCDRGGETRLLRCVNPMILKENETKSTVEVEVALHSDIDKNVLHSTIDKSVLHPEIDKNLLACIEPRRGRLLIFPHNCPHEGAHTISLPKILLRGELIGSDPTVS